MKPQATGAPAAAAPSPNPCEGKKSINTELWHACAGPLVSLPPVGSLVVYFPQGHSEQVAASMQKDADAHIPNYPSLPSKLICLLHNVTLHADAETDEVYAQMTLQPVNTYDKEALLASDLALRTNKPQTDFFCKTLTASDTSTHGGFSVPRRAAEKIFPTLDFSMQPPAQELMARDLHDNEWRFRHIYRGQPKRHLLTTGWSLFVSGKRLFAGDSVLFIRDEKQQLLLGIRRANRQPTNMSSSVLSSDSMHIGILAAAAHAAANHSPFTVFYNPRASPSEFVIPLAKYNKAIYSNQISLGMRFRMLFETEESGTRRYMGTITGISDLDPVRWKNSPWRNLQVGWDESAAGERRNKVSIWEIEPIAAPFFIYPPPMLRSKRPRQPGMPDDDSSDIENLFKRTLPWLGEDICIKDSQSQNAAIPGLNLVRWMNMPQNSAFSNSNMQSDYLRTLASPVLQNLASADLSRQLGFQAQLLQQNNIQFTAPKPPSQSHQLEQIPKLPITLNQLSNVNHTPQQIQDINQQQQRQQLVNQTLHMNQTQTQVLPQVLVQNHIQQQQPLIQNHQPQDSLPNNQQRQNLMQQQQQQQQQLQQQQQQQQQQQHQQLQNQLQQQQQQPQQQARNPAQLTHQANQQLQLSEQQIQLQLLQKLQQQQSLFSQTGLQQPQLTQIQEQQRSLIEAQQQLKPAQSVQLQQTIPPIAPMKNNTQPPVRFSQPMLQQQQQPQQKPQQQQFVFSELPGVVSHLPPSNNLCPTSGNYLLAAGGAQSGLTDDVPSCSTSPSTNNCSIPPQQVLARAIHCKAPSEDMGQSAATILSPGSFEGINSSPNLVKEIQKSEFNIKPSIPISKGQSNVVARQPYMGTTAQMDYLDTSSSVTSVGISQTDGPLQQNMLPSFNQHAMLFRDLGQEGEVLAPDPRLFGVSIDGPLGIPLTPDVPLAKSMPDEKAYENHLPSNMVSNYPGIKESQQELSSSIVSQSFGVPDMAFNSIDSTINDGSFLNQNSWVPPNPPFQRLRTYTKVYKRGAVGRSIDITRYSGYDELKQDLARMFSIEGQLEDRQRIGWKLVYVDHENDVLLVGDDPWEEFVNCVRCIRILSPQEVQQMSLDGDLGTNVLPNQACSSSDGGNVWRAQCDQNSGPSAAASYDHLE